MQIFVSKIEIVQTAGMVISKVCRDNKASVSEKEKLQGVIACGCGDTGPIPAQNAL